VAERWARSRTVASLMERAREDIEAELPPPPFPGGPRLRPLATRAEVNDASRRFENCLRDQLHRATDGSAAFYEWSGEPPVVLEIYRDPLFGWRLEEAKLRRNETVTGATRQALIDDLRVMGVSVGRTSWEIHGALARASAADFTFAPLDESIGWRFET